MLIEILEYIDGKGDIDAILNLIVSKLWDEVMEVFLKERRLDICQHLHFGKMSILVFNFIFLQLITMILENGSLERMETWTFIMSKLIIKGDEQLIMKEIIE